MARWTRKIRAAIDDTTFTGRVGVVIPPFYAELKATRGAKSARRTKSKREKARKSRLDSSTSLDGRNELAIEGLAPRACRDLIRENRQVSSESVIARMVALAPAFAKAIGLRGKGSEWVSAKVEQVLSGLRPIKQSVIRIPVPRPAQLGWTNRLGESRFVRALLVFLIGLTISIALLYGVAAYATEYNILSEITLDYWALVTPWASAWIRALFGFAYYGPFIIDALAGLAILVADLRWTASAWEFEHPEEVAVLPDRGLIGVDSAGYWPGRLVPFLCTPLVGALLLIASILAGVFLVIPDALFLSAYWFQVGTPPPTWYWIDFVGGPLQWFLWPLIVIELSNLHLSRIQALFDRQGALLEKVVEEAGVNVS